MKVKCTAMLGDVYMKSNEISFEVKAPPNAPALESREKNGKKMSRGKKTIMKQIETLVRFFLSVFLQ